jgi:hypothetical protein
VFDEYISRNIVFDEHVFSFAQLRPNAGARLRAELPLLPDALLNSSSTFGDAILRDQQCTDSAPTNAPPSSGVSFDDSGENLQKFNGNLDPGGRHFMCIPGGDSLGTTIDVDAPSIVVPPVVESSSGTQSVPSVRSASAPTGSSMPTAPLPSHSAPDAPHVAAQIDPVIEG